MASKTDFNGNVTTYVHDARGLETSRTEASGTPQARTVTTAWHSTYRLPVEINEPGRRTVFSYDSSGNRLSKTITDTASGESRTWAWTYNAFGQVLTEDGPRSDVSDITAYTYNNCSTGGGCGQIHTLTNALGQVTTVTSYDASGRPLSITDANGVVTTLTYSPRGWLTSRTHGGATTAYDYDGVGQMTRVTLPDGSFIAYTYDPAHRLTGLADSLGNRIAYTLDAAGNRTREEVFDPSNVLRKTQSQVFDVLSRLKEIRGANGQLTEYGYDLQGNRTSDKQAGSFTTASAYDALNRPRQITDAANGITQYQYDALDQLTSVTDPKGLVTGYEINAFGEVTRLTSPDTGTTVYAYDAGNRRTQTDARGVTVTYSYDALNRLTFADYPDTAEDVRYFYDGSNYASSTPNGIGRLTGLIDEAGELSYVYDARGNRTQEQRVIAGTTYTTSYTYDLADRLSQISYPTGRLVQHQRDSLGRVTKITTTVGGVTTTVADAISYLPFGGVAGYTLGNGVVVTKTFDQDYRLDEQKDQGGAVIRDVRHYYDPRDNLTATEDLAEAARSQTFGYDALSRLTSAEGAYGLQGFSYDSVGNRLSESVIPAQAGIQRLNSYSYDPASHRLQSISGPDPVSFAYDPAGNVTAKGALALDYNAAGRLRESRKDGQLAGSYIYSASGQRAIKVAGEVTPDYPALAAQAEAQAQEHRSEATRLNALADQYDAQASQLLSNAAAAEQQAQQDQAQAAQLRQDAQAYAAQAQPYLDKAATWQQRADEDRQAASNATGKKREALLRQAEREQAKADEYRAKAQPYVDQQTQALAQAAQLDQQAQTLLQQAQQDRSEAARLTQLAQDSRAQAQQELAQADTLEAQAIEYRRLAQERPPQVITHFVHDSSGHLLGEYKEDGTPRREYVWLGDLPLALTASAPSDAATTAYFHTDHLGTPQKLTDQNQAVVWDATYEPFGKTTITAQPYFDNPLRFPGQYFDAETGLHQNWMREYDPATDRYLEFDPIGLRGGNNGYIYGDANPTSNIDPMGLYPGVTTPSGIFRGLANLLALTFNFSVGAGGSISLGIPSFAADSGFSVDSTGTMCLYSTFCPSIGIRVPGGSIGIVGSVGTGKLCSGEESAIGVELERRGATFAKGQLLYGPDGAGYSRGIFGFSTPVPPEGAGAVACVTRRICND